MTPIIWTIIIVVGAVILWFIVTFNGLIRFKNRTQEAFADIDVQLKRRHDLIPNLIETVKGYATHERELFEKVTQARTAAINAQGIDEKGKAENMLSQSLKSVFAVAENYPELKASQNFMELQGELRDTEDKVQAARRFYNANVRDWNTLIQQVPTNLVASTMKFTAREFFEVGDEAQREAPKVQF
jgi:LemA protein